MQLDLVRGLMFYSFHSSGEVRRPAGLPVQVSLHIREAMTQVLTDRHPKGIEQIQNLHSGGLREIFSRW